MNRVVVAKASDANALAPLIFASGPENLTGIFVGHNLALSQRQKKQTCIDYLSTSLGLADGQFGYQNQFVIRKSEGVVGCVSYWCHPLSESFSKATLDGLLAFFGGLDSALILQNSQCLSSLVVAPNQRQLAIGHLCVAPKFHRQGLAKTLLDHCEQQARLLGKDQLILDVAINNHAAISLYTRFGFYKVAESQPSEEGQKLGLLGHIHMQKPLNAL